MPRKPTAKAVSAPIQPEPDVADGLDYVPLDDLDEQASIELASDETPTPDPVPTDVRVAPTNTFELATLDEQDDYINGLWYGEQGTGKTSAVATMANLGPIVFINAEAGLKKRPLQRLGVHTGNIRVFPNIQRGQRLTFETLEDLYWALKAQLEDQPDAYVGIVWDSLTEIHKKLLDNVVLYQVEKADRAGRERERFFIDRADYGVMSEQVRLLLRRFRDLPCHFAMTALQRRDQDDDGEVRYGPAVTPALQNDVLGFMDVTMHTRVVEVEYVQEFRALTGKGSKYEAKDRFGVLPRLMVSPTFERVEAYVNDRVTVETDDVQREALERARRVAVSRVQEASKTDSA